MFSLSAELCLWRRAGAETKPQYVGMVRTTVNAPLADGGNAAGSANGEIGRLIDEPPNLHQVKENSRIDGVWSRGVVVRIGNGFEDLWRQLKPWAVERRYVPPMSVAMWLAVTSVKHERQTWDGGGNEELMSRP